MRGPDLKDFISSTWGFASIDGSRVKTEDLMSQRASQINRLNSAFSMSWKSHYSSGYIPVPLNIGYLPGFLGT